MERTRVVSAALLNRHPLPQPDAKDNKDARGRILVVGGSAVVPGAVLLAGVAALRAGAGKLQLATVSSAATALAIAVPESLVVALPQTAGGEISQARSARLLEPYVAGCDALLVGPGMSSGSPARQLLKRLIGSVAGSATLILDAAAINAVRELPRLARQLHGRIVITPHEGEMATLLEQHIDVISADPAAAARSAAERFGALTVLKGAETWIAEPAGSLYCYREGRVGLATSGSGDTLAGIIAGLAARGAQALTAAIWGVHVHGMAGNVLARKLNPVGFLARELLDEVPAALRSRAPARGKA